MVDTVSNIEAERRRNPVNLQVNQNTAHTPTRVLIITVPGKSVFVLNRKDI